MKNFIVRMDDKTRSGVEIIFFNLDS